MSLKMLRQLLKGCADDKRLRIINVLSKKEMPVNEICLLIKSTQPTISKHLAKLRMLKIVVDRREGNSVYYRLNNNPDSAQYKIIEFIISNFAGLEAFAKDKSKVKK